MLNFASCGCRSARMNAIQYTLERQAGGGTVRPSCAQCNSCKASSRNSAVFLEWGDGPESFNEQACDPRSMVLSTLSFIVLSGYTQCVEFRPNPPCRWHGCSFSSMLKSAKFSSRWAQTHRAPSGSSVRCFSRCLAVHRRAASAWLCHSGGQTRALQAGCFHPYQPRAF